MSRLIQFLSTITFATLLATAGPLYASSSHQTEMGVAQSEHSSAIDEAFLVKQEINGYDVSFHIMKAKRGKAMGGSHDFMIKVEKEGKALTNIAMNTKVIHPNGASETKNAMKMGEWLMAGYDLGHEGRHQVMILFKTADGKTHKGGIYYLGNQGGRW